MLLSVTWHMLPPKYGPRIATLSLCIALKVLLYIKARHNATKQHEGSLPGNVTARHGSVSRAQCCCRTPRKRRQYQTCTNRNDSRPCSSSRKHAYGEAVHFESGNLQTKLGRGGAGAQYLWLRYVGWGSDAAPPRSPPRPPRLARAGAAVGTRNQSTRPSQKERQLIGLLATVLESHLQHPRSIQQLSDPHGAVQGIASPEKKTCEKCRWRQRGVVVVRGVDGRATN